MAAPPRARSLKGMKANFEFGVLRALLEPERGPRPAARTVDHGDVHLPGTIRSPAHRARAVVLHSLAVHQPTIRWDASLNCQCQRGSGRQRDARAVAWKHDPERGIRFAVTWLQSKQALWQAVVLGEK